MKRAARLREVEHQKRRSRSRRGEGAIDRVSALAAATHTLIKPSGYQRIRSIVKMWTAHLPGPVFNVLLRLGV